MHPWQRPRRSPRLGFSVVPNELAAVMDAKTSLHYFFNVHPATAPESFFRIRLGPAHVKVVFHGMNRECPVFSVTACQQ